ncbi:MAG: hypothetical protein WBV82_22565, partial [Myxococcaceae bacterium]
MNPTAKASSASGHHVLALFALSLVGSTQGPAGGSVTAMAVAVVAPVVVAVVAPVVVAVVAPV